jgi:hypothetical protein
MFDEAKCIVVTKSKPTRIVARGKRNPVNGLYFLRSETSNLGINSLMLDLPVRTQNSEPAVEIPHSHPVVDNQRLQANCHSWNPQTPVSTSTGTQIGKPTVEIN